MEQICDNVAASTEEEVACLQLSDAKESDSNDLQENTGDIDRSDGLSGEEQLKAREDGTMHNNNDDNVLDQIHPMSNPVILMHMFELCPVEDLATFRQVNKLWYKLSLQAWRSEVTVTLNAQDLRIEDGNFFWDPTFPNVRKEVLLRVLHSASDYPRNMPILQRTDLYSTLLQKFVFYIEEPDHECTSKPFRNFHLEEWAIQGWCEQIIQFTNVCGPFITKLELNKGFFHDLVAFRNVLFNWFPNLEKLTLKRSNFRFALKPVEEPKSWQSPQKVQKKLQYLKIDLNHDQLPISWMELLSQYPNLKTFKLFNAEVVESVEMMLNAMKIIRKHDPRKLQIKHLDILQASLYAQDKMSTEVCLLFRDLKLPLESLTIDIGVHRDVNKIQEILQWHTATLTKLDIYRGPISIPYHDFPFGVQLNTLREIVLSDRLSESLSFLRFMPNLAILKICDVIDNRPPIIRTDIVRNTDARLMKNVRLEKCKELRFDYIISSKEMKMLVECLPNVEKLKIPIQKDSQFRLICEKWQHSMSDMELLGDKVDDCTITGLSRSEVQAINKAERNQLISETDDDDGEKEVTSSSQLTEKNKTEPVPRHINITVMKQLRKFTMGNDDILPTSLMDCSAIHGFLKLPRLESLHIASQMSNRTRKSLLAKVPHCTIVRIRPLYDSSDSSWLSD